MILDILYIKDLQVLLTSTADGFVRGWRYSSNGFLPALKPKKTELLEQKFENEIYCMEWDGVNEILYCGQKDGIIRKWDLKIVFFFIIS